MAKTWKSFPIIVSPVKCYIQCSLVLWRLDSLSLSFSLSLSPTPSTFFDPVHFFQGEECEGGERSVFNSFRPYSTQFSFPPLHMAHNVDPAHKYLPGSLSLSKGSLYLNVGRHLESHRQTEAKTRSPFIPRTCHSLVFRVI